MTMPLAEELERTEALRTTLATLGARIDAGATTDAEALAVVLTAARQTFASETVSRVNALSAQALEMARREEEGLRGMQNRQNLPHVCTGALVEGRCYICGQVPSHPIHDMFTADGGALLSASDLPPGITEDDQTRALITGRDLSIHPAGIPPRNFHELVEVLAPFGWRWRAVRSMGLYRPVQTASGQEGQFISVALPGRQYEIHGAGVRFLGTWAEVVTKAEEMR